MMHCFPFLCKVHWEDQWVDLDLLDHFYRLVKKNWMSVKHTVTVSITFVLKLYMKYLQYERHLMSSQPSVQPLIPRFSHLVISSPWDDTNHSQRQLFYKECLLWFLSQTQPRTLFIDQFLVHSFSACSTDHPWKQQETYDGLESFASELPPVTDLYNALSCFPNLSILNVDWGCNEALDLSKIAKLCPNLTNIDVDVNQLRECEDKKLPSLWKNIETICVAPFSKIDDVQILSSSLDCFKGIAFQESQEPELLLQLTPIPSLQEITLTLDIDWLFGMAACYGRLSKHSACPFPNAKELDVLLDLSASNHSLHIGDYCGVFHYISRLCPNIKILELTVSGSPWKVGGEQTIKCELKAFPCLQEIRIIFTSNCCKETTSHCIAKKREREQKHKQEQKQTFVLPPGVPKCWMHKTGTRGDILWENLNVKTGNISMVLNKEYSAQSYSLWESKLQ